MLPQSTTEINPIDADELDLFASMIGRRSRIFLQSLPNAKSEYATPSTLPDAVQRLAVNAGKGVYWTINPIKDGITKAPKDADITDRRNVFIDIDSPDAHREERLATDAEIEQTVSTAKAVGGLLHQCGIACPPIMIDSGNGTHLYYPCDMPNDADAKATIKRLLELLAELYGDAVDTGVFDARRLGRVPGTLHGVSKRMCQIITMPEIDEGVVTVDNLRAVVEALEMKAAAVRAETADDTEPKEQTAPRTPFSATATSGTGEDARRRAYGRQAIEKEVEKLANAPKRNVQLFKTVAALFELVAGGMATEAEVEAAIEDACRRNGLLDTEFDKSGDTYQRARTKGLAKPRKMPAPREQRQPPSEPHPKPSGNTASEAGPGDDGRGENDDEPKAERGIVNFRQVRVVDGEKEKVIKVGLSQDAIRRQIGAVLGPWPKVAGGMLFVPDAENTPRFLDSAPKLFAHIGQTIQSSTSDNRVLWSDRGDGMVSRTQMYEDMRMACEQYDGVEAAPHFPAMPKLYYMHDPIPTSNGKALEGFLAFFNPASDIDREIAKALVVTQFWGGECGKRPAWLVAGPDQDDRGGRGVGKTTFVAKASQLSGGCLSVNDPASGKPEELERRLLSPVGRKLRNILIDNLKALRFSWAFIEATLTSAEISGRQMFAGEGRRPNNLNVMITANGASLSCDMAQRCNVLKLARPTYQSGDWDDAISAYIAKNRLQIWADIGAFFKRPRGKIETPTRWGSWQHDVLSRLENPTAIQDELSARSAAFDADDEEKNLVRNKIADTIRGKCGDPSRVVVKIAAQALAEMVCRAMGERMQTPTANRHAMQLQIPELARQKGKRTGRWYLWIGKEADPNATAHVILPDGEPMTNAAYHDDEDNE